jgi:hypothetical protein
MHTLRLRGAGKNCGLWNVDCGLKRNKIVFEIIHRLVAACCTAITAVQSTW